MRFFKMLILLLLTGPGAVGRQTYTVASIPPGLSSRASAVVRNMQLTIEVKDLENATHTLKKSVTVLNKNGDAEAQIYLWYDKTRQIKSVRGTIMNEFGLPINRFSEKDFKDQSAISDFSLYEDSRIKYYRPAITTYPYTVEYEYEVKVKQTLSFPDWRPNPEPGVSVEKAAFTVKAKPGFEIRYLENNFPGKLVKGTSADGFSTWSWEVFNMKAYRDEPFSPNEEVLMTSVQVAPVQFSYDGVKGSFTNWDEFGRWVYDKLLTGRSAIPPETAAQVLEMTRNVASPKEKAKKIYEYMQQKTRYISVQVGIGGFQPILASEVDRTGYGDCKGLVNYMHGLLKVAGIKSWYTVVEAGNAKVSASPHFASMNQGNHVILCVPFERDTTWLECTNQKIPFGFLSDFTDDRLVVACTENGGKVMRTPVYSAAMNSQVREAKFTLDSRGVLSGEMVTRFAGTQYDNRGELFNSPYTEQVKKLHDIYVIDNLEVKSFKLTQDKQINPVATEQLVFTAEGYGVTNDKRMYIPVNEVNKISSGIREVNNRVNPVYINRGYLDVDKFIFTLPEGFQPESYPQDMKVEKPFGTFSISSELKGNQLTYTRTMQINQGTYPAGKYQELFEFYQLAADVDNRKLVLLKK
ncbi:DUF3857 domain-containing protein [Hufsiella ginkgonis]|uniref:DUF3857 domain-containing protein n=1 Tax=Hufsiella ginkgonis TaxID=2695274 RepID=A0A7K1XX73_9SPHI|nr:DUF3857 domain-containing protein [Hufsiella ginkgonis]MXV15319.1 DUF3857 domain-containing protein [Hufsiella ginkgonis]